ncbi:MAG: aldose 1-epimerase family protein [Clostridia bacterium]|nr:aldose 1-epimerase family protein [Clostridia bacterium]
MLYTIQNEHLTLTVNDMGAEIWSIVHRGAEYLWQGDPTYWSGRAYNLFPICGRLTEGKYTWQGKTYEMNLHGFARKSQYTMVAQTETSLTFRLETSEESLAVYPFDFCLDLTYTLEGKTIRTTFAVQNRGTEGMPFAIGAHPGFNLPLGGDGCFEDWRLEFACKKDNVRRFVLSDTRYLTREPCVPFEHIVDGKVIPLRHNLFDNDAFFLENVCKTVTLCSDKSDRSVTVHYPDMQYLGVWHAPQTEAPYVCIEPWYSLPAYDGEIDDFSTKRDMMVLDGGAKFESSFTITVA